MSDCVERGVDVTQIVSGGLVRNRDDRRPLWATSAGSIENPVLKGCAARAPCNHNAISKASAVGDIGNSAIRSGNGAVLEPGTRVQTLRYRGWQSDWFHPPR